MHLVRPLLLAAISGLAMVAVPAIAQQAPAPVAGADYASHEDGAGNWHEAADSRDGSSPPPADGGPAWRRGTPPGMRPDLPPPPGAPQMAYSREERAGWLDECSHRLGGERADHERGPEHGRRECEAYLERYEASYGGPAYGQTWSYGAGYAQPSAYPVAPAGMMWVPVMMIGQNCCCRDKPKTRTIVTEEEVPEEVVTYHKVPAKIVHTKYTKTVPVKLTKQRSIKSIK